MANTSRKPQGNKRTVQGNKRTVVVQIVSDLMWPWCYVGLKNLDSAVDQIGDSANVSIQWLPFLLRPSMPANGYPKGPGRRVGERLRSAGQRVGINFTGATDRYPNSVQAHALLEFVLERKPAVQHKCMDVLFRHYFTDGLYPNATNLLKAAREVGLSKEEQREALAFVQSEEAQENAVKKARQFSKMGISGVPYFFVNGQGIGSGAQPSEVLVQAIREAK